MSFRPNWLNRVLWVVSLILVSTALGFAQQAVVTHNAILRGDPSSQHRPIRRLAPPDTVDLVQPEPTNGYLHIRTGDGEEGWVLAKYLRVLSPSEPAPESPATASGPPPAPGTAAAEISPEWEKPVPPPTTFSSGGQTCGPSGDGGDTATNLLKNRTDVPSSYHAVAFDAVATVAYPNPAPPHRQDWTAAQLAAIKPFEGVPITVEGYIVAIKPQTSGSGESTNCHWTQPTQVDWHIALTKNPGEGEKAAVVVKTTPRVRQSHPKWTTTALGP